MIYPVCKVVVECDHLARGFELSKGNYVQITEEKLESLEAEANNGIEFAKFVADERDRSQFTSRELLFGTVQRRGETVPLDGRDAGETGRVAIAQTVFHEKRVWLPSARLTTAL